MIENDIHLICSLSLNEHDWKMYDLELIILGYFLDAQPEVRRVNEHGALMYAGRWGIHGVSLPGRATFSPGNVGWVTFGAPRPNQV